MRSLRRIIVAAFIVLGVLALPQTTPVASASTVRANGMVSDVTWYIPRADMDRSFSQMQSAGVKWIRANINWSSIEPKAKGQLDSWWLTEIDYVVSKANAAGIQVLMPIADGVPLWASADPARTATTWNKYYKPRSFTDYADFARAIVTRYAPKGVHAYEVWNEPNYSRFWPSGPSAADYTAMLKAAYPAIKGADPAATVLMGGLSRNDYTFLQAMYTAGARGYFDAAAVHPYTGKTDPTLCWNNSGTTTRHIDAFCAIEAVRNVMVANGDSAKNLWLTEFGWSTSTGASNGVTETVQADYLTKSFKKLDEYPYVTHAFWYSFRNNYWSANNTSDLEANYGLARVDFTLKPAYTAYKNMAGDKTVPVLTNIRTAEVSKLSAKVLWTTNEASTTVVEYWKSGALAQTAQNSTLVSSHSQSLSGLSLKTTYSYKVKSKDAAGNTAVGPVLSFTTLG